MDLNLETQIADYVMKTAQMKARFQDKLFTIFTETTGYRPEDLCIVEERKNTDPANMVTLYYFDLKHRHQVYGHSENKTSQTVSGEKK